MGPGLLMGLFNCWFLVARPLHLGVHVLDLQCEAEELNLMYSTRILKLSAEELMAYFTCLLYLLAYRR
jgi:hypothetical protein